MAGPTQYILSLVVRAKDEASSVFGGITGKITGLVTALGAFLGISAFSNVIQDAAEFEKAMDRVAAKTDDISEDNFARLKEAAEEASKATGRSAVEAAEGLEILAGAGYKTEEAIATLPVVLNTATLEAIGLEEAALAVADSMTVMGIAKTDAAKAGDILAKGANLEATTVTELAEALREGGSAASSFGLDLSDTVAILDVFAKNGLRGSEAGTALNALLRELSNPASKARQELAALGDTSGTLEGAINTLAKAGDRGKLAVLAFGDEAGPGLRALIKEGTAGLAEYEQKLRDSTGTMEDAVDILSGNLNDAWVSFLQVLNNVKRFFVEPLLKPLTDELRTLTSDLDTASKSPAFTQLRTTIKQVFTEGVTAVREFVTNFNFKDALQSIQDFAADVERNIGTIKTAFTVVRDIADTTIQGMASSVDVVRIAFNTLKGDSEGAQAALDSLTTRGDRIKINFENLAAAIDPVSTKLKEQSALALSTAEINQRLAEAQKLASQSAAALATQQGEAGKAAEDAGNKQAAAAEKVEESQKIVEESSKKAGDAVVTAFASLGLKSQQELDNLANAAKQSFESIRDSGTASTEDVKAAWIAYANEVIKGAQNLSDAEKQTLATKLEIEAAIYGTQEAYERMAAALGLTVQKTEELAAAQREVTKEQKNQKDAAEDTKQTLNAMSSQIMAIVNAFRDTSESLYNALVGIENFGRTGDRELKNLNDQLAQTRAQMDFNDLLIGSSIGFDQFIDRANNLLETFLEQRVQVRELELSLNEMLEGGKIKTWVLNEAASGLKNTFDLLDEQQLSGLQSALDAVNQKIKDANKSLEDLIRAEQDAADRRAGREDEILKRQLEDRLQQIDDLEAAGDASSRRLADQARELAERNFREELNRIRAESDARAKGYDSAAGKARELKAAFDEIAGGGVFDAINREAIALVGSIEEATKKAIEFKDTVQ